MQELRSVFAAEASHGKAGFSSRAGPISRLFPGAGGGKQSVWVSDPEAIGRIPGVGPSSGQDAGVPHFSYSRHVVAPILFALGVCGGSFGWAILRDEERRTELRRAAAGLQPGDGWGSGGSAPTPHATRQWGASLPAPLQVVAIPLNALPEPQRTLAAIVAANVAVFAAWRVPLLKRLVARHFAHTPGAGRAHTLLTSVYSHRGVLHLGCNMAALWSFGQVAGREMGREQFLAFYHSAGVLASLASHLWTVWPLCGSNITAAALLQRVQAIRPSIGASGAVIGVFGYVASRHPESQVALVFLPSQPFSISSGFKGMVAFDAAGVLLRWRIFDHQAHLGGASVGWWYSRWGQNWIWESPKTRATVLAAREKWHHLGEDPVPPSQN